jgi:trigger factor
MQWLIDVFMEWLRTASVREIIATIVALASAAWGLLEIFILKPARRRAHKIQIDNLTNAVKASNEQRSAETRRLQSVHLREINNLQARHEEQMTALKIQYETFQYNTARDAGRRDEQLKQLHELIKSLQLRSHHESTPVAAVSSQDVVTDAVREAEKAAVDQPVNVSVTNNKDGSLANPATPDASQQDDITLDNLIPPRPVFPSYLAHQPQGYKGMQLVREVAFVDETVVSAALKRLAQALKTYTPKKLPAAEGDKVTLTGVGYVADGENWKAFDGGKLDKFPVIIGSGTLIPGFEDQLVGLGEGQRKILELSFPADYHAKELAGRETFFQITIDSVEEEHEYHFSDESVKPLGFDKLDDLLDVLRNGSEKDLQTASNQRLKRQMLDVLDAANKFEAPADLVSAEHEALWRAQLQELRVRNLPIDALGKSPEEAKADLQPLAERRVRLGIVMSQLASAAAQDGVLLSEEDIDKAVQEKIREAGKNGERVAAHYAVKENREALRGPLLEDKVTEWILRNSIISNKSVSAEDLLSELL